MRNGDLAGVLAVQATAYAGAAFAPEPAEVYRDRMAHAPDLCWVAATAGGAVLGYLVSHPWDDGPPPPLHTRLPPLPAAPRCWYLHDCAVGEAARGLGVGAALFRTVRALAWNHGLRWAALVAVGDAAGYWARQGYVAQHRPGLADKLRSYGGQACYMACPLTPD